PLCPWAAGWPSRRWASSSRPLLRASRACLRVSHAKPSIGITFRREESFDWARLRSLYSRKPEGGRLCSSRRPHQVTFCSPFQRCRTAFEKFLSAVRSLPTREAFDGGPLAWAYLLAVDRSGLAPFSDRKSSVSLVTSALDLVFFSKVGAMSL